MKKLLLLLFALLFSFGFSQKTTKQKEIVKIFNNKKFYNDDIYLKDLEGAIKHGVVDYTKAEVECLGYYIGKQKAVGKLEELRKYKYEEIYWFSEAECQIRDSVANEDPVPDKKQVLEKSSSEDYQYVQVKFSKTNKGFLFADESEAIKQQISKDFANDKPGNYTAFYDVFYENEQPKIIKLKSRLNR